VLSDYQSDEAPTSASRLNSLVLWISPLEPRYDPNRQKFSKQRHLIMSVEMNDDLLLVSPKGRIHG
jgi:hypothetical protein